MYFDLEFDKHLNPDSNVEYIMTIFRKLLFPKGEFSFHCAVGPLGLSGSLFLSLLVFDFYQPTNRDLYLVGGWGSGAYFWVKIDFFKVVLDLFRKCLGFVFDLKGLTLGFILSFKGL